MWLEDSLKSMMVPSFEVRNKVIDTISEISNTKILKLKFQIGRQKSFQSIVKCACYQFWHGNEVISSRHLVADDTYIRTFLLRYVFELTSKEHFLITKFQLERPSCLGNCSLQSMRLILGKMMVS